MAPPTLIAAMTASTTGSSAVPSAISAAGHHARSDPGDRAGASDRMPQRLRPGRWLWATR
jgi:hypothetical protein